MAPRLRIELLGPVRIEVDGAPLVVDTRKATALLAFLAVSGRPASREAIAAMLWPESDEAGAHGALRRTLSVLKAALGGAGLTIERGSVALRPEDCDVDAWRFSEALARVRGHAHPADGRCASCLDELEQAVALDRGEFMAGFTLRSSEVFDVWQAAEAQAYGRELTGALERLARGRAAQRRWEAAISAARRWLLLDELHEPAHVVLISALAAAGEPAAALLQYRECVRVLDRELGVAPLAETTALAEAIRDGQFASTPPLKDPEGTGRPVDGEVSRSPALHHGPLIGRDAELATLGGGYEATGPDGRLLLVEGEAGIGKTRLGIGLAEYVQARGGLALTAHSYAGETEIAFAPIVELIRAGVARPGGSGRLAAMRPDLRDEAARLMPQLRASRAPLILAPGDPFGRTRLFEALAEILVALAGGPGRGLLWVDDLHRANSSTLEFVGYLARRLRGRPIALLVTWRPEELGPGVRDQIFSAPEGDGLAVPLELARFERPQVAALVTSTLGHPVEAALADALFDRSEGLPLYVAEALAAPTLDQARMPDGVVALLQARIDAVGPVARQVLSAAAVIGRSFDLDTVRLASGRTDTETVDGLDELVRRRLVLEAAVDESGALRYDFTHGRLRDVAYERLSLARRRLLHARVADVLGRPTLDQSDVGRWSLIAYHEELAGRSIQAAEAHRLAGEAARQVFANGEARGHLEAALALGHPDVAQIHGALGAVLTLLGDYDGAVNHLETAIGLAGPEREAELDHGLAIVLARAGDRDRADRYLVSALAATGPDGDPGTRAQILVERGAIAERNGDSERAEAVAREALGLGEVAGDPSAIARAEDLLGIVARNRGDMAAAREHLERAIAAADLADSGSADRSGDERRPADPGVRIAALNTLALVCSATGDRAKAIELTREALGLCERQGDLHRQAALENNLADLFHAEGRADEAMDHLKRAVVLFAQIGTSPGELEPEVWKLVEW